MRFRYVSPHQLNEQQFEQMFQLMQRYYEDVTRDQFSRDLKEKTDIILLMDGNSHIQGFSTILYFDREIAGRKTSGVFSGDTILNRDYWGNRALTVAFGLYLSKLVLGSPFRTHYWFLMSKGYKTYLLMTNNTIEHFPSHGRKTPVIVKALMDGFYGGRYGSEYEASRGVVFPNGSPCRLKHRVADIEPHHLQNENIRFFAEHNPGWKSGVELACVSRINLKTVIFFGVTLMVRQSRSFFSRGLKRIWRPRPA